MSNHPEPGGQTGQAEAEALLVAAGAGDVEVRLLECNQQRISADNR